ncbi:hypothetical protein EDD18DRAFT_1312063 [Armillaria luteobubalina]|uniref:Uncharacterized protein n=1 Tax=Armillaria luteobubalina TaxID=153913 RepID=A0AA39PEE4_9AGAR|nr:hypothetical protein EDD18DRAFT_1312063 [Armillaria luteobubalina]
MTVTFELLTITSDSSLNPWRRPILRNLRSATYEDCLRHLSVRQTVPRQNWIEILSLARPSFILFDATLPNLKMADWEECFNRRFLPGWKKWKKDGVSWREAFIKLLHRVWHRSQTSCTADESWTKYVVLNRNGSANELEVSSRTFNPVAIFNDMKLQSNLAHLETRIRLVVTLADVRILTFGTLNRPRSTLMVNPNAHVFLHPPGIEADENDTNPRMQRTDHPVTDHGVSHFDYPWFTPGGSDKRWLGSGAEEEEGLCWVGGLMVVTQIVGPKSYERSGDWPPLQDLDLVLGPGRQQYASFTWNDLSAIAPWMEERITKKINGPGLGI